MRSRWVGMFGLLLTLLVGCAYSAPSTPEAGATPSEATRAETAARPDPTSVELPTSNGAPQPPEEAILILEPGPGSRLVSPVVVAGLADPTFEQTLVVRIVFDDGSEVALQAVSIAADVGERGRFAGEIPISVSGERQAFIQVYAESARDGGVTHLASVGVILAGNGPREITPVESHPEQIVIEQPVVGEVARGGRVQVRGFGWASFEGTLFVEVLDAEGSVVGTQVMMVEAPDMGLPGPFSADISYELLAGGPGRIVVRDISPAFGGNSHLASVEIQLEP